MNKRFPKASVFRKLLISKWLAQRQPSGSKSNKVFMLYPPIWTLSYKEHGRRPGIVLLTLLKSKSFLKGQKSLPYKNTLWVKCHVGSSIKGEGGGVGLRRRSGALLAKAVGLSLLAPPVARRWPANHSKHIRIAPPQQPGSGLATSRWRGSLRLTD